MKKLGFAAAAAAIMFGGAASAADVMVAPPAPRMVAPAPAFSWSGLYFGVQGGGGWGPTVSDSPADFDISGPYVGAHVGAAWQVSSLVLGVEADANWSGLNGVRNCNCIGGITTMDLDWFGTVRGLVGFAAGTWMPYVTGGWAWGQLTRDNSNADGPVSVNASGWTVGGGVKVALTPRWIAKGEYKYIDFGSDFYNLPGTGADPTVSTKIHTVEIGLSYKF